MLSTSRFDPMRALAARARPWASVLAEERATVVLLAAIGAVAHALNMFNYPSWVASSQEGTTVYRAWALLQGRELWGDALSRSPATTLLLAGWLAVTGGPQGFGAPTDGGRMLMLLLHVGSVALLFGLARLLGCGMAAAAVTTLLFALSPLVIVQQRLVVADNFVAFWALLGVYLVLRRSASWLLRAAGGVCVGLALLSLETGGRESIALASGPPMQQLLATLNEPFLALGAAAVLANLLRGRRDPRALLVGLAGAVPLMRIGAEGAASIPVFVLAVPLSLNVGLAVAPTLDHLWPFVGFAVTAAVVAVFVGQYGASSALRPLYLGQPASAEREAVAWTRTHIPPQAAVAADLWAWPGFQDAALDGVVFTGLRPPDRLELNPPEYVLSASDSNWTRALDAEKLTGGLVKRWVDDGTEVELRKTGIGVTEDVLLAGSSQYAARRFERGGAFFALDGTVTSDSQANAMLRAVWSGDRDAFVRSWRWTSQNLTTADRLLASVWRNGTIESAESSSDADVDAALALLMASRRWTDEEMLIAGRRIVDGIWRREVAEVDGRPYLAAGDWARDSGVVAASPGGFAPYAYDVFAAVDPDHDWSGVVESSYRVLFEATQDGAGRVGLPPEWIGIDRSTGALVPLPLPGRDSRRYGDDAAPVYWRVALHRLWSSDARADRFLNAATFLREEVARRGAPASAYAADGRVLDAHSSGAGIAGALAALLAADPAAAHNLYASQLVGAANRLAAGIYWGDLNDLHGQEWAWLATALYANRLPDLWRTGLARPPEDGTL